MSCIKREEGTTNNINEDKNTICLDPSLVMAFLAGALFVLSICFLKNISQWRNCRPIQNRDWYQTHYWSHRDQTHSRSHNRSRSQSRRRSWSRTQGQLTRTPSPSIPFTGSPWDPPEPDSEESFANDIEAEPPSYDLAEEMTREFD